MALSLEALLGRFTEQAAAETIGFGIGTALSRALEPEAIELGQDAWVENQARAVDPEIAAAIVAEDVELMGWGTGEAAKAGINGDRFAAMVNEVRNGPGLGELLRMRRRGTIGEGDFAHGLRKLRLEDRWDGPLGELGKQRLDPAVLAVLVQRGVAANDGILPVGPPTAAGRVPPMPTVDVDPVAEAAASGIDRERFAAMARIVGLPPGPGELLQLLNRGTITETDYLRGIAEGNTRNEWAPFLLELRRRLLTPHEYVEARVRGWIDDAEMHRGAALSGLEQADTDLLFKVTGRPLSFRQVFIGERRGGHYNGATDAIDPAFLKALQESNIRPEWYSLAWAQRFTYPSAFVLRQLTTAGELTSAETEEILLFEGWAPALAAKVAKRWAGSVAGAGKHETQAELADEYEGGYLTEAEYRGALDALGYAGETMDLLVHLGDARRIKRWREKIIDAIADAYLAFRLDDTTAGSELAEANVTGEAATMLLRLWAMRRRDTVRLLTPAQIKKAAAGGLLTREAALAELEHREYSAADAAILLDE